MSRFRLHYKNKPYRFLGQACHSETLERVAVYECLYPNERGSLWVRPEAMFHGEVALPHGRVARFRAVPLEIRSAGGLTDELWASVGPLAQKIFGPGISRAKIDARLAGRAALVQAGFFEGEAVGVKIGYVEGDVFYSWLGGVRDDRRKLGVATDLATAQHQWAFDRGLRRIRTKTLNEWTEMLILNLRQGFRITGTEPSGRGLKIVLEKSLDVRPSETTG